MSKKYQPLPNSSTGSSTGRPSSGPSTGRPLSGPSSGRSSIKNKLISNKKIFIKIGILIGILIIIGLVIGGVASFAFGPSQKVCPAPSNMEWIGTQPFIGDSSLANKDIRNSLKCINSNATPSPSSGSLIRSCTIFNPGVILHGDIRPTCPPPTTQSTTDSSTPGSSNSEPSSCLAISGTFEWNGPAPTYGAGFSSNIITCTGPSPTPTPGNTSFACSRNGTITPFTPCPGSDGFTNYLGELMDWISGRPDINQQSKYLLLPGYSLLPGY